MIATITPAKLHGSIEAIASKSYAHRIIIASALADKPTEIYINGISNDVIDTVNAVNCLGANAQINGNIISVEPIVKKSDEVTINITESGTTARMILPVATALYEKGGLCGKGSLVKRPFAPLVNSISEHGVSFSDSFLPISFEGRMTSGEYKISGSESSQYISALMYALPLLKDESKITLTSPLASEGYVDITLDVLKQFGITGGFECKGNERYISPGKINVEGDWSNSAFWLSAGIDVNGLNNDSCQRDRLFDSVKDKNEIDAEHIPDLVPILAIYAAGKNKTTRIYNVSRLRIKESDRIKSVCDMISSLGGDIEATDNEMTVHGKGYLEGGVVNSYNDHRIVMSAAIASTICKNKVIIRGCEAVNKSYPLFFKDFNSLGGKADVK
ncbi:MAG: 3-phosphoshikimate 1-carboxyvinyltransferase [Clostridia bacterium]|nr:3-phosphoshikimate 1-carboxyvinyltransferase [Clostridia bacterium]